MAWTDYNEVNGFAGDVKSLRLTAAADTYYKGMPLAWDSGTSTWKYNATAPEVIAWEDVTLSSSGELLCLVSGSEFLEADIVDDTNATLTITDAIRASFLQNGIILR